MNERGVTLLETVLGVAILSLISFTLLPLLHQLQGNVYHKKLAAHASGVALQGVQLVQFYGQTSGQILIDSKPYNWQYHQGEICVEYEALGQVKKTCIDKF